MTSDPARRQPIRAQVVSKPKISTSAKVKMEGSGAERPGGAGPGVLGGRRRRGRLGSPRRTRQGPLARASRPPRPSETTARPREPPDAPHFARRLCTRPGRRSRCTPGSALGGLGGAARAACWCKMGRHFPDLLHGRNSCSGAARGGGGLSGLGGVVGDAAGKGVREGEEPRPGWGLCARGRFV